VSRITRGCRLVGAGLNPFARQGASLSAPGSVGAGDGRDDSLRPTPGNCCVKRRERRQACRRQCVLAAMSERTCNGSRKGLTASRRHKVHSLWTAHEPPSTEGVPMNRDQVKGRATQAKGKLKETAGKATGSPRMKNEGRADQLAGKAQATYGDMKKKAKDAIDKA
jgi:uncharacterized protein YjbJ (UPF0337 family)